MTTMMLSCQYDTAISGHCCCNKAHTRHQQQLTNRVLMQLHDVTKQFGQLSRSNSQVTSQAVSQHRSINRRCSVSGNDVCIYIRADVRKAEKLIEQVTTRLCIQETSATAVFHSHLYVRQLPCTRTRTYYTCIFSLSYVLQLSCIRTQTNFLLNDSSNRGTEKWSLKADKRLFCRLVRTNMLLNSMKDKMIYCSCRNNFLSSQCLFSRFTTNLHPLQCSVRIVKPTYAYIPTN